LDPHTFLLAPAEAGVSLDAGETTAQDGLRVLGITAGWELRLW
jgi:hypothetical protein